MSLTQADQDFAKMAETMLPKLRTDDLLDVLSDCCEAVNIQIKRPPSREGARLATFYVCSAITIIKELERRENPNKDIQ